MRRYCQPSGALQAVKRAPGGRVRHLFDPISTSLGYGLESMDV
jgi:hypothetical protein